MMNDDTFVDEFTMKQVSFAMALQCRSDKVDVSVETVMADAMKVREWMLEGAAKKESEVVPFGTVQ